MIPPFLQERDPDWREDREWRRDAYAQRGREDRPLRLNFGYGAQPFTVDDACEWAERRCEAMLP